jgi:hypothetical protein
MTPSDDGEPADGDLPLCWVTAVRAGPVPEQGLLFLGFDYSVMGRRGGSSASGPNFVMTRAQARELVERLRDSLAVIDAGSRESEGKQKG